MEWTITHQLLRKAERNKSWKQWENHMTGQFCVKTDGCVSEVSMRLLQGLRLKMIIDETGYVFLLWLGFLRFYDYLCMKEI